MGEFFRFVGERMMTGLVLALIAAFFAEIRLMKKETAKRFLMVLGIFWGAETVHVLASGLIHHVLYGSQTFPALYALFRSPALNSMYAALESPSLDSPISGALAYAGHALGAVLFGESILGGFLLAEGMSIAACCLISARLRERYSDDAAWKMLPLLLMLPGAVFLFLPGWGALLFLGAAVLFYCLGKRLPQRPGLALPWIDGAILTSAVLTMAIDYALVTGRL